MDKEDDEIRFRDQCAMQIVQAVIAANRNPISYHTSTNNYGSGNSNSSTVETTLPLESYLNELLKESEKIADFSYKLADAMRKARLKSFT